MVQKIYSKIHPVLCLTHHDVTDLVNHRMVKNTNTWISWKRNIIFLWNEKILNLYLRRHILRSYRFLPEVTFNRQCSCYLRTFKISDLHSFLNFRFLSFENWVLLSLYFVATPKSTSYSYKWFPLSESRFLFIFVTILSTLSRKSFLKIKDNNWLMICSSSFNIKGTMGRSVWNGLNMLPMKEKILLTLVLKYLENYSPILRMTYYSFFLICIVLPNIQL